MKFGSDEVASSALPSPTLSVKYRGWFFPGCNGALSSFMASGEDFTRSKAAAAAAATTTTTVDIQGVKNVSLNYCPMSSSQKRRTRIFPNPFFCLDRQMKFRMKSPLSWKASGFFCLPLSPLFKLAHLTGEKQKLLPFGKTKPEIVNFPSGREKWKSRDLPNVCRPQNGLTLSADDKWPQDAPLLFPSQSCGAHDVKASIDGSRAATVGGKKSGSFPSSVVYGSI